MPKLGTKIAYLGLFGLELKKKKTIVIFEISTLEFLYNKSLTHAVTFGIGSPFSEGLGSAFSEGLGPAPLYKECFRILYLTLLICVVFTTG